VLEKSKVCPRIEAGVEGNERGGGKKGKIGKGKKENQERLTKPLLGTAEPGAELLEKMRKTNRLMPRVEESEIVRKGGDGTRNQEGEASDPGETSNKRIRAVLMGKASQNCNKTRMAAWMDEKENEGLRNSREVAVKIVRNEVSITAME